MIFPLEFAVLDSTEALDRLDEVRLVRLVRNGHREAFDEIDRRYRGKLCRFLARHTSGPEHAEEIAQQSLVKAFLSIDSLREHDKFAAWLYRIAFRLAVDASRKIEIVLMDPDESDRIVDQRSGNETQSSLIESDNLWLTAREVLTPNEYSAIWLKYVDGYKIDSIARIMRRTRISVRVLLFRARKKLLVALEKELL